MDTLHLISAVAVNTLEIYVFVSCLGKLYLLYIHALMDATLMIFVEFQVSDRVCIWEFEEIQRRVLKNDTCLQLTPQL